MKKLVEYILEELKEEYKVYNLKVTYDSKVDIFLEVPKKYTDSKIQMYIDDALLPKMPSSEERAEDFFGENATKIIDAYFGYDELSEINKEKLDNNTVIDIKFDSHLDSTVKEGDELKTYHIRNLKFIISFDEFTLTNVKDDNEHEIQKLLFDIFKTTISNNTNKYPIELYLDKHNIEFEQ